MVYKESTIEGKIERIGEPELRTKENYPQLIYPSSIHITSVVYLKNTGEGTILAKEDILGELSREYEKCMLKVKRSVYITDGFRRVIKEVYIDDKLITCKPVWLTEVNTSTTDNYDGQK